MAAISSTVGGDASSLFSRIHECPYYVCYNRLSVMVSKRTNITELGNYLKQVLFETSICCIFTAHIACSWHDFANKQTHPSIPLRSRVSHQMIKNFVHDLCIFTGTMHVGVCGIGSV